MKMKEGLTLIDSFGYFSTVKPMSEEAVVAQKLPSKLNKIAGRLAVPCRYFIGTLSGFYKTRLLYHIQKGALFLKAKASYLEECSKKGTIITDETSPA